MKIILINQARMTSTRLPGKILKEVLGKPLLEFQIERLKRVKLIERQIVATTRNLSDDPVEALCKKLGVECFRGSELNVLSRYYEAAKTHQPDALVRVTSDCPLIDPQIIDQVIEQYLSKNSPNCYAANIISRTYPRGMDTEVFSFQALEEASNHAKSNLEQEHVTPYISKHALIKASLTYHENKSDYRWTVDTPEDFEVIKRILEFIYPIKAQFTLEDLLEAAKQNPEWKTINAHIEQKSH